MAQDFINVLVLSAIYLLFALGISLAWGTVGILNFAHGAILMFAAFVDYLIVRDLRLPFVVLIVVGMIIGAALSVAAQVLAFQPIQRRSKNPHTAELQILIGGIGIGSIPLAIAQKETKSVPFGFSDGSFAVHGYEIAGVRITNIQIMIVVAGLVLGIGIAYWLKVSWMGLALRSIGVDGETASIMGIDKGRLAIGTMAVSGALAGLAGVLLTFQLSAITPETGDTLLLKAFAAIVLGGVGSMVGVMAGSFVLALAEVFIQTQTSGTWVDAVSFGVIFLVLLVRPQGIFGRKEVRRT
ncbi:MAG: branched-chain amino acid transporter permease [Pseudonocardiales bacterium]|nr:branched-chain amino acid transporter permease [Pseudonocardiales bacterium]